MKKLTTYILLFSLAFAFTTCKKRDEKLQKLIIGTWEVKLKNGLMWGDYGPQGIDYKYIFKEDGIVVEELCKSHAEWDIYSGGGYSPSDVIQPCVTKYKIANHILFIEYQIDSLVYEWHEIEIKKLYGNKMILIDHKNQDSEWTYKKIN
jgi:hypothetical protein